MAAISIPCPKCQSKLKLKDRSLLGKTGKCPKCQHRFVLQEPAQEPVEGINPTWIPDEPASPPIKKETENPLAFLEKESDSAAPLFSEIASSSQAAPVYTKKRGLSKTTCLIITFLILFVAVGGVGYFYMQGGKIKVNSEKQTPQNIAVKSPTEKQFVPKRKSISKPVKYSKLQAKNPTSGKPIKLLNMPAGVRIVINLHPKKLWSDERQYAEFRASLGPLGNWLETQIRDLSKQQNPAVIEEMLIGIILGPMGTPPEIAAVIHFAEEQKRSELLTTYDGTPHTEFSTDLKIKQGRAYHIIDNKTVATCPAVYVEDLLTFEKTPALTGDNIQEILKSTDRDRFITVAFDPTDIRQHLASLLPATAKTVAEKTLRWLGEDVWSVAWSVHVEDDFYTELTVRGLNEVGPTTLSRRYRERLDAVPEMLLTTIQKMEPKQSGYRQIIGRYPAMMKVVAMTTAIVVDGRFVRMGTLLPLKAGPNLALGTLLAWDESTRTDFNANVVVKTPKSKGPDVASLPMKQRLERKIDVDFRRTPLQEAFAYIAEESKIKIEVDGDALKLAGFTKNMPQTFKADQVPVREAIYGIIKKYVNEDIPLVIHVSAKENKILVLTKAVAESRKQEIYQFKKKK